MKARIALQFLYASAERRLCVRGQARQRTELVQLWQIFISSSYTNSTQRRLGGSSRVICGLTSKSKATSGTNRLGFGPVELRIAVRISATVRLCSGLMDSRACPKTS